MKKTVKDYSDETIVDTYLKSYSLREALRKLNINESGVQIKNIKMGLDNNNVEVKNKFKLDGLLDNIKEYLDTSCSYNELARKSGYLKDDRKYLSSSQLDRLKKFLDRHNLDHSHIASRGYAMNNTSICTRTYTDEEIFVENSFVSQTTLKLRYMKIRGGSENNIKCDMECGVFTQWNGCAITLHLDHVNGIRNDNRFNNLRLLCPNCHSQTKTYGGKNFTR